MIWDCFMIHFDKKKKKSRNLSVSILNKYFYLSIYMNFSLFFLRVVLLKIPLFTSILGVFEAKEKKKTLMLYNNSLTFSKDFIIYIG